MGKNDQLTGPADPEVEAYFAIPLSTLRIETMMSFDLYLRPPGCQNLVLYRRANLTFSDKHRLTLVESGVHELHVRSDDRHQYLDYLTGNLGSILDDAEVSESDKADVLYGTAKGQLEELFEGPGTDRCIRRINTLAEHTVTHLMKGAASLHHLLKVMSFDYKTYTHSINVCVFGVALGRRVGLTERELGELGNGLLLHDFGKTEIPSAIVLKKGPLTPDEWAIMKQHPDIGLRLLETSGEVPSSALAVVHQHHEKASGRGYPQGLTEERIHRYAKIASLTDVFDALTTRRTYKDAVPSFPALRTMQEEMEDYFDAELLRELILMLSDAEQSAEETAA